jgi:hypothetical protein
MPTFEITSPDGRRFQINAPDGASQNDVLAYAKANMPAQSQRPAQADFDPTEGMSTFDKYAAGVGKSVSDLGLRARQLGSYVGIGDPQAIQQEIDQAQQRDRPLMNTGAGMAGDLTGQIATSLLPGAAALRAGRALSSIPTLARAGEALIAGGSAMQAPKTLGQAAAVGAGLGAMAPVTSDDSTMRNMVVGALGGAAGNVLPRAVGRVLAPQTSQDVRMLMQAGVTPTPGQILGGAAQRIEEGLTSIPIVGDAIKSAQVRGIEQFNKAAYNRALGPIGASLPKDAGHEAVEHVSNTLSNAYNELLPKLNVQIDGQFGNDLDKLRSIGAELPDAYQSRYGNMLQKLVLNAFDDSGAMTGRQMKSVDSNLGALSRNYLKATDPDQRMFGQAVAQTQAALRDLVMRSNPEQAQRLADINEGWANLIRISDAASKASTKEGVFTPAQLKASVRATDSSLRKGDFAKGNALMQDLANAGANVMGSKVPDSGTPFRLANALAATGAYAIDPTVLGGGLATAAMYTPMMQKMVAGLLTKRPESLGLLGNLAGSTAPLLGPAGAAMGLLNAQ